MVKGISRVLEPNTFRSFVRTGEELSVRAQNLQGMPIEQKDIFLKALSRDIDPKRPDITQAYKDALELFEQGKLEEGFAALKPFTPNEAAVTETSLGTAVMAKGWKRPIIFPKKGDFKFVGWADKPSEVTTEGLWDAACGSVPGVRMGAVGYSNVKPEQVRGGSSISAKDLSQMYEDAVQDYFRPVITYLTDNGAKAEDIGYAFAHSDCGVDRASRAVIEEHGLKGFATTPTEYTPYVRGTEIPPSEEFPNGAVLADFPFPTVLTRNAGQIVDYAKLYGLMVGKDNPLAIFGGRQHAFIHDTGTALLGKEGSRWIPVDIMKDRFGIEVPAKDSDGNVINASRHILDSINSNPHEQYKYAFNQILPSSQSKQDLTHDGQKSIATIAYTELAKAGKIGK